MSKIESGRKLKNIWQRRKAKKRKRADAIAVVVNSQ
jgi:hypothetical protein